MKVIEAIKKRQSIRSFSDKEISKKIIRELLEAARLSPSSKNTQPWKFKIIQDQKTRKALKDQEVFRQNFVYTAPLILICCADLSVYKKKRSKYYRRKVKEWAPIDITIATHSLVLRATELGLGTCYIGLMQEKKLKKILNIPKNYLIPYILTIGYPRGKQIHQKRKPLKEMILK